jgi:hypothetical protein
VAVDGKASAAHCPAQGQADPGFLCLYVDAGEDMLPMFSTDILNLVASGSGADKRGFYILATADTSSSIAALAGTWTLTAR